MTTKEFSDNATLVQALREMLNSEAMKLAMEALENESPLFNTPEKTSDSALIDYGYLKGFCAYPRSLRTLAYPPSSPQSVESTYEKDRSTEQEE